MTLREIYNYAAVQVLEDKKSYVDIAILLIEHKHFDVHDDWIPGASEDDEEHFSSIIAAIKKHLGDDC